MHLASRKQVVVQLKKLVAKCNCQLLVSISFECPNCKAFGFILETVFFFRRKLFWEVNSTSFIPLSTKVSSINKIM